MNPPPSPPSICSSSESSCFDFCRGPIPWLVFITRRDGICFLSPLWSKLWIWSCCCLTFGSRLSSNTFWYHFSCFWYYLAKFVPNKGWFTWSTITLLSCYCSETSRRMLRSLRLMRLRPPMLENCSLNWDFDNFGRSSLLKSSGDRFIVLILNYYELLPSSCVSSSLFFSLAWLRPLSLKPSLGGYKSLLNDLCPEYFAVAENLLLFDLDIWDYSREYDLSLLDFRFIKLCMFRMSVSSSESSSLMFCISYISNLSGIYSYILLISFLSMSEGLLFKSIELVLMNSWSPPSKGILGPFCGFSLM